MQSQISQNIIKVTYLRDGERSVERPKRIKVLGALDMQRSGNDINLDSISTIRTTEEIFIDKGQGSEYSGF